VLRDAHSARKTWPAFLVFVLAAISSACATRPSVGPPRTLQGSPATQHDRVQAAPEALAVELEPLDQLHDDPKAIAVYAAARPGLSVTRVTEGVQLVGRLSDWSHGGEAPEPPLTAIRVAMLRGLDSGQIDALVELARSTLLVEERDEQPSSSRLKAALERALSVVDDPRGGPDCRSPCKAWTWQTVWSVQSTAARAEWRLGTRLREAAILARAERHARRALEAVPAPSHPLTAAVSQRLLGAVLQSLGDLNDDDRLLSESLESTERALAVFRSDRYRYDWALTQKNIQTALSSRLASSVSLSAVDDALAASDRVLEMIDSRTPNLRARVLLDRAQLLRSRWARSREARDLSEATRTAREAAVVPGARAETITAAVALTRCDLESETASQLDDVPGLNRTVGECERLHERALPESSTAELDRSYGLALGRLAIATRDSQMMERAVEQLERAIEEAERLEGRRAGVKMHADYAWGLLQLAALTASLETARKAASVSAQALNLTSKQDAPPIWGQLQLLHGVALEELGWKLRASFQMPVAIELFRQARAAYARALEVFSKDMTPKRWAELQERIGQTLWREAESGGQQSQRLFAQAIECYERALTVHRREVDPAAFAHAQLGIGTAYLVSADQRVKAPAREAAKHAATAFRAALDVYQQAGMLKRVGSAKAHLAEALAILDLGNGAYACDVLRLRVEAVAANPAAAGPWESAQTALNRYEQTYVDKLKCSNLPAGFRARAPSTEKKP